MLELNIRDEDIMLLLLNYDIMISLQDLFYELEDRDNLNISIISCLHISYK